MSSGEWFESWFDSPWYPILYRHRDFTEAEAFILRLLEFLEPPEDSRFLDLACGRGRHSRFIHQQGFDVTGLDLSPASIADARAFESPGLRFGVQDMREPLSGSYSYIFNLFTSFGYFRDRKDNLQVLQNVRKALNPGGVFVLDFMNAAKVLRELVSEEQKTIDDIRFDIRRGLRDGVIVKEIGVTDKGVSHRFEERVQAIEEAEFREMFARSGLKPFAQWGDYAGNSFDIEHSPRLIWFCQRL